MAIKKTDSMEKPSSVKEEGVELTQEEDQDLDEQQQQQR